MLMVNTLVTSSKLIPAPTSPPEPPVAGTVGASFVRRRPAPAFPWRSNGIIVACVETASPAARRAQSAAKIFIADSFVRNPQVARDLLRNEIVTDPVRLGPLPGAGIFPPLFP